MEPHDADDLSRRHLLERLGVVERFVADEFERRRQLEQDHDDWRLRGVYVTEDQVERLLDLPTDRPVELSPHLTGYLEELEDQAAALELEGHRFQLRELATRCGLDELDVHLLLAAAAASFDPRFELVFGYLNDDVALRTPTVGLAIQLAGLSTTSVEARTRLSPDGALALLGLVEVARDEARPPLGRTVTVPPRVADHLLGDATPSPLLRHVTVPMPPLTGRTADLLRSSLERGVPVTYVHDPTMTSAMSAAAGAAAQLGHTTIGVDLTDLPRDEPAEALVRAAHLEAVLTGSLLVVGGADVLAEHHAAALRPLTAGAIPVVLCGRLPWAPSWSDATPFVVRAEPPTPADTTGLWRLLLGDDADRLDVERSLAPLRLSPQQAVRAVRGALQRASVDDRPVEHRDVLAGVRGQNASGLERLTRRIAPDVGWDDLVVPSSVEDELRLVALRWRNRDRVFGQWRLSSGASGGRGVGALFAGPSGTGKTLAAQVVAADLGLDLYIVDLSTVVDKYIGETSKNLDRIFDQADRVNGVLLFDEADALFGKRSAVTDSKDRNANLEVAYLLQRIESYDGIAILTTNLASNLDDAFLRRLDAIIDFPRPDADVRQRLWETLLRPEVPRSDDVDTAELAKRLHLSGGEIRNVVLTACFRAAERGTPVAMDDLMRAAVREHRKLQKPLTAAELGPHGHLLG